MPRGRKPLKLPGPPVGGAGVGAGGVVTGDVARETLPVPSVAAALFGDRSAVAQAYAELLGSDGIVRGLLGPRERPRIWDRHILNCVVGADQAPVGSRVCDVGSGAGLPGLVWAIARSDLQVTLVEPLLRRATFLTEATEALQLSNVRVLRVRAEQLGGDERFDVVTSRAVAPLPRLLDWSMPLVRPGGVLLAMKGSGAREELRSVRAGASPWRVDTADVLTLGVGLIDPPATVIRLQG